MLRVLISTGALLMLAGFGAAGWQVWRGLPQNTAGSGEERALPDDAGQTQSWLISPNGGIVRRDVVRAFLEQDRFVRNRMIEVTQVAALSSLLADGEKLPDAPYLEVLADIRAPMIAQALCPALTATVAKACAVQSARVVKGSVDPIFGTAIFQIELVYRQKASPAPLPDLAAHVLRTETLAPFAPAIAPEGQDGGSLADPAPDEAVDETAAPVLPASAETALAEVLRAVVTACADEDRAATCRLLRVSLDWDPGTVPRARAEVAWLAPLPDGITAAPPLEPLPKG